MAGPSVVQAADPFAKLQAGLASMQELGKFLEGQRQFNEDQTRLNRMQDANWGKQMLDELVKTTDAHSIKDVAKKYPGFLSLVFQRGLGIDEGQAMPMITALAQSAYNDVESTSWAHTIWNRFGTGDEDAGTIVKDATARASQTNAGELDTGPAAGRKTIGVGTTPAPVPERPDFSTTTPVTTRPTAADPSLVDFKGKLNALVSGMKVDPKLGMTPDQRAQVDSLVGQYQGKSPAVDEFIKTGMGDYAGRVANAGGTLGTEQLQRSPVILKDNFAPEAQAKLTTSPTAGGQTVAPSAAAGVPATTISVKETTPQIDDSFQAFIEAMGSGSAGQIAVKGKKLGKEITPYVSDQLQSDPEGIKAATDNALFILTDPVNARALALEQNAASVYATDQDRAMSGAQGKVAAQKYYLELQKLGYETEKARLAMIREGINSKEDQAKMIAASFTASMIESGILPPDMAASLRGSLDAMNKEEDTITKMKTANADEKLIAEHTNRLNGLRTQYFGMLKAAKDAIGQANTPEAKAYAASMDQKLQYTPYVGWLGRHTKSSRGKLEMTSPKMQVPTMTQGGADLSKELGL